MKKLITTLALVFGLLACGGGSSLSTVPVQEKPSTFYMETTKFGGSIVTPAITCPTKIDPETQFGESSITGDWGVLAGLDGTTPLPDATKPGYFWRVEDNLFKFDFTHQKIGIYPAEGFALITSKVYDKNKSMTLKMQARMTTESTDGAFTGITLIAGEGDYCEIAYLVSGKEVQILRVAPCEITRLGKSNYDWNDLELKYDPSVGWNYILNGESLMVEPINAPGAALQGNPRVGLYFVAITEGSKAQGYVRNVEIIEE